MSVDQPSEAEVRAMRDRCFGQTSTDKNWLACREYWMQPSSIAWLMEHSWPLSRVDLPAVGEGVDSAAKK